MKLKKGMKLIVFSAVLLLLIAGCKGGSKDTAGKAPTTPFLGGSQGLEIGFLEGSPPDEVTDGDNFPFNAIVRLKNVGEYKFGGVNHINVSLAGFLPNDFRSVAADFTDADLQNKTPTEVPTPKQRDSEGNIIEAIETLITFPKDDKYFKYKGSVAGNTNFVFKADVCYKYQTKAVSEICVLSSLINIADDAICKPSETKTVFSSGSPIKVASFRQNVVGDKKIQFSFDVEHAGQGNVFDAAEPAGITAAGTALDSAIAAATTNPNTNTVAAIATARNNLYTAITATALTFTGITAAKTTLDSAIAAATTNPNTNTVAVIATARNNLYTAITAAITAAIGTNCPRDTTSRRTKEDTIKVTVDTGLAIDSLSCPVLATTPLGATTAVKTGSVKLVNGKRTITCTQDLSSYTSDFKRSIDITIDFNYLDGISKNVLVKHIVTS